MKWAIITWCGKETAESGEGLQLKSMALFEFANRAGVLVCFDKCISEILWIQNLPYVIGFTFLENGSGESQASHSKPLSNEWSRAAQEVVCTSNPDSFSEWLMALLGTPVFLSHHLPPSGNGSVSICCFSSGLVSAHGRYRECFSAVLWKSLLVVKLFVYLCSIPWISRNWKKKQIDGSDLHVLVSFQKHLSETPLVLGTGWWPFFYVSFSAYCLKLLQF